MSRKAMVSGLLTLLLLLNSSGLAPAVLGSSDDDGCWADDRDHYVVCLKTEKCRSSCVENGFVDGRCPWVFPNMLLFCQCLQPNCPPVATDASG